jgi:hypothetical protein
MTDDFKIIVYKVWGSRNGDYEKVYLVGYNAV